MIRDANISDINAIVKLNVDEYWDSRSKWEKSSKLERWELASWWGDPYLLKWHFTVLESSNGGILIAVENNKIVAELDFVVSPDIVNGNKIKRLHIIWLLVHKNYRHQGIATNLINELRKKFNLPIWVEAEDERSDNLYKREGFVIRTIHNWELNNALIDTFEFNIITRNFKYIRNKLLNDNWSVIIGNYYAPLFDVNQLIYSKDVNTFIWGNSGVAPVIEYENSGIIAILTQYPRIYVKQPKNLENIIKDISRRIFMIGFDSIYLQTYAENNIDSMLKKIGYKYYENNDPVYQL